MVCTNERLSRLELIFFIFVVIALLTKNLFPTHVQYIMMSTGKLAVNTHEFV